MRLYSYRLTPLAERVIWVNTEHGWSLEQANRYVNDVIERTVAIAVV